MKLNLDLQERKIIALTGLMGVGKTTIGNKLAEKLDFYFIDSDQEIEDKLKQSIVNIFQTKGEKYFRQIEKEVIKEIFSRDENIVLSLGGGAFIDDEIRSLIKHKAISIWLYADIETLLRRVANKNHRPLLDKTDKRSALSDLMIKRYPIYKQADIHIETSQDNQPTLIKILINEIDHFLNKKLIKKEIVKVDLAKKSYDIIVGSSILKDLPEYIKNINSYSKVVVITDKNVATLHLQALNLNLKNLSISVENIVIEAGEKSKSFDNLQSVLEQVLEFGIDRKTLIIAFGGGVVGDLSGFVASILLRGIDFIQIPTTLLASVDSSVGGKTAINSKFGKNLIGSFYQPKLVFCDLDFLKTLPKRDFISGYAEVVKSALVKDKKFFFYLDKNLEKIKNLDLEVLQKIIVKSCQIKAEIVALDEKENNLRALLNFGHTFGHIFETETGFSNLLLHGEAVAIGMIMAVKISINLKFLDKENLPLILNHFKRIGLPISALDIRKSWNVKNLIDHLYKDKKVENKHLTFILLEKIGLASIQKNVSEQDFLNVFLREI